MSRWERIQELFEETAALDALERARVLRERSGGDLSLARAVEGLVAADAAPLAALDRSAVELLQELRADPPAAELCGLPFGAYRIEAHIASGGMAHVYRAVRASEGTERRVALKVLRPSLDTEAFLARFRRERELLAALEHEHVVAFLDAGALPDGRPFLVMEYVEGVPVTDWSRGVALATRLRLFLQVLAAVQYAHQQLVVHRDLKPSNVLVTREGTPKLLDFGVAAAVAPEGGAAGGHAPLTPTYASPEQLRGEPVTTASDVYSLGVLLHELATGAPPARGAGAVELRAGGDLGAIVGKAVAEDVSLRYRSADDLAGDLRRLLAHEPVSARPATWSYRARLLARRHRWPLAVAVALVFASIGGWIASDLARRRAEREASFGWGAHGQARAVARIFESWIVATAAGDPLLADRAAAHLERALSDDLAGALEAEMLVRLALAELYAERGDRARAAEHANRAWALTRSTRGVNRADRERAEALRARLGVGEGD